MPWPLSYLRAGTLSLALVVLLPRPAVADWPSDPLVNVPLCTTAGYKSYPSSVEDGVGGVIVTWYDSRGGSTDIYAQHVLATGVVDPSWPVDALAVCTADSDQVSPSIIADGAGGAIIAWCDLRNGIDQDMYAQHVLASGAVDPAWPADGRALCTATGDQTIGAIVTDGAGGAIVVWYDIRIDLYSADIYAQHVEARGVVDPAWPADGLGVCTADNIQGGPAMVSDGAGGAIVAWQDYRAGNSYLNADIYAQRIRANGVADPAWPAGGRALCTAANSQGGAVIITDGAGGAIVGWGDGRTTDHNDIYAQHVLASGVADPAWPADGSAVCTVGIRQYSSVIVTDGAGGAIFAWGDNRGAGGYSDIYAQHLRASGSLDSAWPSVGLAVCTAGNDQNQPALIADGAGGFIVAWNDYRNGYYTSYDVYALHVAASGAPDPAWPAAGRALSTALDSQWYPTIVADSTGGAIVAWQDARNGNYDIYAQRVQANGDLGGSVTPTLLSLVSSEADEHGVRLKWFAPGGGSVAARVYRRAAGADWQGIASVNADAGGLIRYEDRAVEPGSRYGYRLGVHDATGEQLLGETWVTVPSGPEFSLEGLRPNPAHDDLFVSFSLPTAGPVYLDLVDLSGRIVARPHVDARRGSHVINLRVGRAVAPGIYLVRLTQGERSVTRKACVVR
jgi:hypothetical protein